MDKTCEFLERLGRWVATHGPPPVIHALPQRQASVNLPRPLIGLVYQDGAGVPGWTIGETRHAFPDQHAALLHTHVGSQSDAVGGDGPLWITTLDMDGVRAFDDLIDGYGFRPWPVRQPAELRRLYTTIVSLYNARTLATRDLRLQGAWLELLATMLDDARSVGVGPGPACPETIARARAYIDRHYLEPSLTLGRVAAAACLDEHHLGRQFRRYFATTPMRYLRTLRLEHGKYLLRTTAMRVSDVAAATGFSDPLYFTRTFRQATGRSPSEYRAPGTTPTVAPTQASLQGARATAAAPEEDGNCASSFSE